MDYRKCAQEIYDFVGKRENLISAAHCATRLRLVTADNSKVNIKKLEDVDGVKGVFSSNGQLQIILGTGTVNKVYDEFLSISGMTAATKADVKAAAAKKQPLPFRMVKALGDVFVPILPAIVAAGLIMGLLEGMTKIWPDMANSGTYQIFHLFSNAAFVFLPILVAVSAARVFGGNIFLGAVIGMIMVHTDLVNAWSVAGMLEAGQQIPQADVWFGLYKINLTGYQGHVIPVIIAVWFMSFIEKRLHKIVPEMIDLFVTPLVTVLVTGYLTLTIFGPVFAQLEEWVLVGVQWVITIPWGIGAAIVDRFGEEGATVVAVGFEEPPIPAWAIMSRSLSESPTQRISSSRIPSRAARAWSACHLLVAGAVISRNPLEELTILIFPAYRRSNSPRRLST